jgi:hypothetical protein
MDYRFKRRVALPSSRVTIEGVLSHSAELSPGHALNLFDDARVAAFKKPSRSCHQFL